MPIKLKPFNQQEAEVIAPWFDDAVTAKWLGDRSWVKNIFRLLDEPAGTEFRGAHTIAHYAYAAYDGDTPVGLIHAGIMDKHVTYNGQIHHQPQYSNIQDKLTASLSFVVAPTERQKGYGKAMITMLTERPEFKDVKIFKAGVEPENVGSINTLKAAGFVSNLTPDFEGMYYFLLHR